MSDIWSISGEWEFSGEEILRRKNALDLGEYGTFVAHRVTKESGTWAFSVHGEYEGKYAVLEVVLDVQELPPEPPEYPITHLERELLPQEPEEMTAGEILSLPWSEYVIIFKEVV